MLSARGKLSLTAATLLSAAALAASASAAVPGLELVTASVNNPLSGLDLPCPPGKEILGTGGFVGDGDSGQVKLVTLWPASFFSARVDATTDQDGFTGFWSVGATATCADPLPGREVRRLVVAHAAADPSSAAFGRVGCPTPGKKVVGMGARLTGVRGQVALTTLDTIDDANAQVIAQAVEDQDGFAGDWQLEVLAVCADPLPGYEVVHRRSAITSAGKALDAPCPAGKLALSGGARTEVDGIDQAGSGQVVLDDLTVQAGLRNVRATALEDQDGFARAWQLKTTAICAAA
jgi:hypothetical protein